MDDIDNLRREIINHETFCFYPYLELSVNPAGHVKPCCYFDGYLHKDITKDVEVDWVPDFKNTINIQDAGETLERIWDSDGIKSVRKAVWLKEEKFLRPCRVCARDGEASMRVRSIKEYKNNREVLQIVKDAIDNDFKVSTLPRRLELKPSNLCNLKCVMCNSYDSSQIEKELEELSEKYSGITIWTGRYIPEPYDIEKRVIVKDNNVISRYDKHIIELKLEGRNFSEDDTLWESFVRMVPNLETLSFAGGEPTLLPFVERALSYCVETGHSKHITVYFSSNVTNINKKLLALMTEFKLFEMICSIDGYKTVQEYTRFPSKWSQVEKNYTALKALIEKPNVKVLINVTVNALNVCNLDQLLYWIEEQAQTFPYFSYWPYNLNMLWNPSYMQVCMLPKKNKELAINKLETYKQKSLMLKDFPGLDTKIDMVINELKKHDPEKVELAIEEFSQIIGVLDEHRGVDITTYIPSLLGVYK